MCLCVSALCSCCGAAALQGCHSACCPRRCCPALHCTAAQAQLVELRGLVKGLARKNRHLTDELREASRAQEAGYSQLLSLQVRAARAPRPHACARGLFVALQQLQTAAKSQCMHACGCACAMCARCCMPRAAQAANASLTSQLAEAQQAAALERRLAADKARAAEALWQERVHDLAEQVSVPAAVPACAAGRMTRPGGRGVVQECCLHVRAFGCGSASPGQAAATAAVALTVLLLLLLHAAVSCWARSASSLCWRPRSSRRCSRPSSKRPRSWRLQRRLLLHSSATRQRRCRSWQSSCRWRKQQPQVGGWGWGGVGWGWGGGLQVR